MSHDPYGSQLPTLDELANRIQSEVDAFALTIGNYMDQAKRRNARRFMQWVQADTPFSLAEAERLRVIAIAYRDLPPEAVAELPRPSSALSYVLESADTAPFMSATRDFTREDIVAGALLGGHPENLGLEVLDRLRAWLGSRSDDGAGDDSDGDAGALGVP